MRSLARTVWICALCALAAALPVRPSTVTAQTPDRSQAEAMAQRAAERMARLHREAETLAAQERTLLDELRRLEVDQQLKEEELKLVEANRAKTAADLEATKARILELESTARSQLPGLQARFVDLYKLGRAGYLRLLLNVADLNALGRAYRMVSELARLDSRRVAVHRETLTALRSAETQLGRRAEEMARHEATVRQARDELERAVSTRNDLIESIDERRDLAAQFLGELQLAQQRLQNVIAASDGKTVPPTLPLRPFKGDLDWPARGRVITEFGEHATRGDVGVLRLGIEIAAPEGRPVLAVHDGRVAFADSFSGFGNLVIVEHGPGAHSLYGYLSTLDVTAGATIRARQVVGTVGRAPAGPAALYFELRIDGEPVNPLQWLKR